MATSATITATARHQSATIGHRAIDDDARLTTIFSTEPHNVDAMIHSPDKRYFSRCHRGLHFSCATCASARRAAHSATYFAHDMTRALKRKAPARQKYGLISPLSVRWFRQLAANTPRRGRRRGMIGRRVEQNFISLPHQVSQGFIAKIKPMRRRHFHTRLSAAHAEVETRGQ